jgi:Na+-driven multidrug efflux pump
MAGPFDLEDQEGFGTESEIPQNFGSSGDPKDVQEVVANLVVVFLGFMAIIFMVMLILAGFNWMTAQGNQEKVDKARSQIKNAIIGIIVILAAYAIVSFVLGVIADKV